MAFWITALGMALLVAGLLIVALVGRRGAGATPAAAYDLKVYRDQLQEVERDRARGLLSSEDAERAKVEISRRILEADRALETSGAANRAPEQLTWAVGGISAAILILGTVLIYFQIGAPGMRDLPLQTRIAELESARAERPRQAEAEAEVAEAPRRPAGASDAYMELVEQLRAAVADRPDDIEGNMLLVRHEAALGRFRAAYAAQARLIEALGEGATAEHYAGLAELMILSVDGYVSPEAEQALTESLRRDPSNPSARYYSGLMFAQAGRFDMAFRLWQRLLQEGPADAPWIAPIRAQIGDIAQLAGERFEMPPTAAPAPAPAPGGPPGPSAEDMEAASQMSEEDRAAMIRGMVASLADRLATEGGPPEDWARLIGAYGVLGEADAARAIYDEAREVFADTPEGLAQIEAAARRAGIAE